MEIAAATMEFGSTNGKLIWKILDLGEFPYGISMVQRLPKWEFSHYSKNRKPFDLGRWWSFLKLERTKWDIARRFGITNLKKRSETCLDIDHPKIAVWEDSPYKPWTLWWGHWEVRSPFAQIGWFQTDDQGSLSTNSNRRSEPDILW